MYTIWNGFVVLETNIINNFLQSVKDLPHSYDTRCFWIVVVIFINMVAVYVE